MAQVYEIMDSGRGLRDPEVQKEFNAAPRNISKQLKAQL